ncbi:hypothetical protein DRO19_05370 [Candidatus Bathyarchaeota archaeon]|mgnify:CR=1 FL=1|nr:MAG: hypothetical protein DRO19_05370 [Candidatus Bathyarchaeota archaeon]
MPNILKRLLEAFIRKPRSGYASPNSNATYETPTIPLADVIKLYERDPACKASVDLLAASTVGMGFYTTADEEYPDAEKAKDVVDQFNEEVNLDALLQEMARVLIACGNDFWLKVTPEKLTDLHRLPIDAIERIEVSPIEENRLKIPYHIEGYKLSHKYGGETLKPNSIIHWKINCINASGFGMGVLQVLLHSLIFRSNSRPAYAWMKAKIERIMPKIFEKYAGPDVLALLEKADEETIKKFERVIKTRPEEGAWLFYSGKGDIKPILLDPRARFEYYVEHIINQVYLGCETPLPRLFSTPGFTEASARAALDLQEMLIKPIQRYIKRQVEREIFDAVLMQAGFNPAKAKVRLNWGSPEVPEINFADMLKAAELGLIRAEEFRKNAVKFGWELWEKQTELTVSQSIEKADRR